MPAVERLAGEIADYLEPAQVNLVRRAYYYAEQAHDGQLRSSGEHYVTHPLAVATILADMHMDHQSLMAAMLHDVIEDTGIPKEALVGQFGESVANLVDGVSKLTQMKFGTKAEAQAENFQKMAMAMARDIRVILVKLADRLHNMRTLGALNAEKRRRIAKETLEIYAPIANRLGMNSIYAEFEDLGFKAMHPMRAERIASAVKAARGNRKEIVNKIEESIVNCLTREGMLGEVSGREKHLYSIYRKMRDKRKSFNEIMDVYAFRIVVDKADTCYRVLGAVHSLYKPIPGRFKDYIAIPKANGYQSLHTTLFGMHGVPIEIQIRTREMEELANKGIAAHWLYKSDGEEKRNNHARARQWVQGLLELQKNAGNSLEFIENVKIDLFPDEVYVFSPKGRILELPKGATPVDFAYAIHTDVGSSCMACRVNRRMAPLSQPLESGATVEIITSPTARPSPSWLNFVVTGKARTHIRHALKQQQREESVTLGARLLEKALDAQGTKLADIEQSRIQALLDEYQQEELDDLLESIGLGSRTAHLVARRLLTENTADFCSTAEAPLVIHGTEGMVLNYARCCTPIPGDPIVGHLSAGKGMVVHRDNCKNVADIRNQPDKCIPLSWAKDIAGEFSVDLRIELVHQRGLIALLAATISEANANIEKISVDERDGRMSIVQLSISLGDRVHLARVMRKLRSLAGVTRIIRNKA
ncbi:bifunctional GTP diphosphokinase/guanosine-3',5'-bis pyrophosphate 3'-pyrophosphohydrolase [Thiopseudomonas acetoxidans]|uniref:guanosine-3',5'-bis(diphosphate) 3'-diphosphatase n=1 Tax=Thiopseudomonas acetoxidans TaxID=3041622 RepID=A0ABT7SKJ1_9GAMM|nr:bifunctional GTP diphosphokinase/guanosine-3',5'-bis pyrophosphate 3'-pyrophosphohydrolase [Thiopseudomonas sp. CY1220]MDM7856708.1 bifunctional GTP diphosphokinase/guanosine-3',5'-bis pyrophosphate 3'-pyrophosphohydrolase [Thiopseudomonas sp. CY1220]